MFNALEAVESAFVNSGMKDALIELDKQSRKNPDYRQELLEYFIILLEESAGVEYSFSQEIMDRAQERIGYWQVRSDF